MGKYVYFYLSYFQGFYVGMIIAKPSTMYIINVRRYAQIGLALPVLCLQIVSTYILDELLNK